MTLKTRTILGSSNKARETTTATSIKKFPVNAPQKTPVRGKKPQKTNPSKEKKKSCIKGKRSSAQGCMLPVRHSRSVISVFICAIMGSTGGKGV